MVFDLFRRGAERRQKREAYAGRIPPGQALTEKWPVLHYDSVPSVDLAHWSFEIFGLLRKPVKWNYQEFMALPKVTIEADMHCVTGWTKLDNRWEGVSAREVLRHVVLAPQAAYVMIHAYGDYTTNLPLDVLRDSDVLFAYRHNGQDLTPEHGWPLRLVVPKRYAWKSAKWVRALEFVAQDQRGFWERYGYHNNAEPWQEERYSWQE